MAYTDAEGTASVVLRGVFDGGHFYVQKLTSGSWRTLASGLAKTAQPFLLGWSQENGPTPPGSYWVGRFDVEDYHQD